MGQSPSPSRQFHILHSPPGWDPLCSIHSSRRSKQDTRETRRSNLFARDLRLINLEYDRGHDWLTNYKGGVAGLPEWRGGHQSRWWLPCGLAWLAGRGAQSDVRSHATLCCAASASGLRDCICMTAYICMYGARCLLDQCSCGDTQVNG
jgi:hypothetical protein